MLNNLIVFWWKNTCYNFRFLFKDNKTIKVKIKANRAVNKKKNYIKLIGAWMKKVKIIFIIGINRLNLFFLKSQIHAIKGERLFESSENDSYPSWLKNRFLPFSYVVL